MDRGAWWAAVHGVAKSQARLSDFTFTFHFHALEKEMATQSSVLVWRIPGTGEPGRLPSLGSHRVGHDWSDLAAAAAPVHGQCLVSACSGWWATCSALYEMLHRLLYHDCCRPSRDPVIHGEGLWLFSSFRRDSALPGRIPSFVLKIRRQKRMVLLNPVFYAKAWDYFHVDLMD